MGRKDLHWLESNVDDTEQKALDRCEQILLKAEVRGMMRAAEILDDMKIHTVANVIRAEAEKLIRKSV